MKSAYITIVHLVMIAMINDVGLRFVEFHPAFAGEVSDSFANFWTSSYENVPTLINKISQWLYINIATEL